MVAYAMVYNDVNLSVLQLATEVEVIPVDAFRIGGNRFLS